MYIHNLIYEQCYLSQEVIQGLIRISHQVALRSEGHSTKLHWTTRLDRRSESSQLLSPRRPRLDRGVLGTLEISYPRKPSKS